MTADCHGTGAVEHLIPNQIAVNKLWAMALLHEKTAAFPKIFYDRTKIDRWTNKVGTAIGVVGNPNDAVATSFRRQDMSSQVIELVEKTIRLTKEFMGAADVSQMNFVIETDNSTPWAESIQMKTLENLFEKGILTDAYDFVSAIPQSRLKNKRRILAKLKTAMPNDRAKLSGEK